VFLYLSTRAHFDTVFTLDWD